MPMLNYAIIPAYIKIAVENSIYKVIHVLLPDTVNRPNIVLPEIPGYHFDDYYTTLSGSTKFNFSNKISTGTYTESNPLIIYGRYGKNQHTVTYAAGEGTGTMTDSNSPYDYDDTVTVLSSTFTPPANKMFKEYFIFGGGLVGPINPTETFKLPDADVTLTAQYIETYTVTYDANTGTGTIADTNSPYAKYSTVTTLASTGLTPPEGKQFSKWNTKADGTGTDYAVGVTFTIQENTTLYAQWVDA